MSELNFEPKYFSSNLSMGFINEDYIERYDTLTLDYSYLEYINSNDDSCNQRER